MRETDHLWPLCGRAARRSFLRSDRARPFNCHLVEGCRAQSVLAQPGTSVTAFHGRWRRIFDCVARSEVNRRA